MSDYFDQERAISTLTKNTKTVMKAVANRYLGQNPPKVVSFYAYQKNGIRQDRNYRFVFNFHNIYPLSALESNIYAWSKLYSDQETEMSFEISCFGPAIVYCNGERAYKPNVLMERRSDLSVTFSLNLKKGWNSIVLRFIHTNTGCGGILSSISSRNRPLSFIIPSTDREGQKGWLYTLPLDKPLNKLPEPGMSEDDTGLRWYPVKDWLPEELVYGQMKRMYSLRKDCYALGWSRVSVPGSGMYTLKGRHDGIIRIYLDNQQVYHSDVCGEYELQATIQQGEHNILVLNECGQKDWGFTLECSNGGVALPMMNPAEVKGTTEVWLYAGPFPNSRLIKPVEVYSMDKPLGGADGKIYWRLDKPNTVIRPFIDSKLFGQWNYPLGVTLYGLIETGRSLKDENLIRYVAGHVELCTRFFEYAMWDSQQYGAASMHNLLTTITTLDDCGSFGSLMLEASEELKDNDFIRIAEYIADFIENKLERLPDGAFYRVNASSPLMDGTLWADDLYMSVPFLCRYYKLTGKSQYIDDAAKQLILFHKYLYRPGRKIMSHVYDLKHKKPTEVSWGRGNGWTAFSYSEILAYLPEQHPLRKELLRNFNDLCEGYLALQDDVGLWHQVLDDFESYREASCTSMFTCAFARGVRNGWLEQPEKYITSAGRAWDGLCNHVIDVEGNVYGTCRGSGFSFSADYYKNDLSWLLNDTHGIGILLLAGVEYCKLTEWLALGGNE